jgi:polar amino acid transport system substrate-binding protein
VTLAAVAALALPLSACHLPGKHNGSGSSSESSPAPAATPITASPTVAPTSTGLGGPLPTVTADPSLVSMVPTALQKAGVMKVGTDTTYAPDEFLASDGHTAQGFDIDLLNAVAAKLGLRTSYESASFDSIIPGVESGKYDFSVSSFTINADREKVVDMVSYFSSGVQWAQKAGSNALSSIDDACGKKVAAQTGTIEADDLATRSKACTKAGKPAITIGLYQGQDEATAAVVSGQVDAMSADSQVTAYAIQQTGGKLVTLGPIYEAAPYGFVIKKGEHTFAQAVANAVNELIADGSYKAILDHWGVDSGAIAKAEVDPTPVTPSPAPTTSASASPTP